MNFVKTEDERRSNWDASVACVEGELKSVTEDLVVPESLEIVLGVEAVAAAAAARESVFPFFRTERRTRGVI